MKVKEIYWSINPFTRDKYNEAINSIFAEYKPKYDRMVRDTAPMIEALKKNRELMSDREFATRMNENMKLLKHYRHILDNAVERKRFINKIKDIEYVISI